MKKILLLWDVKTRGSPATLFYRELRGYNYKTKSGKCHSEGILDKLPDNGWDFVSRSALLVNKKHAPKVVKLFRKYDSHLKWKKYIVEDEE